MTFFQIKGISAVLKEHLPLMQKSLRRTEALCVMFAPMGGSDANFRKRCREVHRCYLDDNSAPKQKTLISFHVRYAKMT
ncbi:MAG: hypothetical protein EBW83_09125 [Rhodobacterales bacterium]|nr:hypothetical protein [Rhodobacterales bacterium]